VVTCAHVITDALGLPRGTLKLPADAEVSLDFPLLDETPHPLQAHVIFWKPENAKERVEDIAGLTILSPIPASAKPMWLLPSLGLSGHRFRTCGFPLGRPNGAWATGICGERTGEGWVQLEGISQQGYALEPGFSGAPIWDDELHSIVGMAVANDAERLEAKVAFMIPASLLVGVWQELGQRPVCPYQGLSAFEEENEQFFFGREVFIEKLVAAVQAHPLVSVIGPSGCGKSSVVKAGLVPQLKRQSYLAPQKLSQQWKVADLRPGDRPFRNLAQALISLIESQPQGSIQQLESLQTLEKNLWNEENALRDTIEYISFNHPNTQLLLVIDQFEELYTLCKKEEQQRFLHTLLTALNATQKTDIKFTIILTLRADFLGEVLSNRELADLLEEGDQLLGPMSRAELKQAIEKPAAALGVVIEDGLTQRLLDDVGNEPGNLPLLEFALTQLWQKLRYAQLKNTDYDEIEYTNNNISIQGIKAALVRYAEDVYTHLQTQAAQEQARHVFIQLVKPGEGTPDTRRLATRKEIGEENWKLVRQLADARLVVTNTDSTINHLGQRVEDETAELVHEALIRGWFRLQDWLNADRDFYTWQERLRTIMRQWEETGQDENALLQGSVLMQAEAWLKERHEEISQDGRSFIKRSIKVRDRKRRRTLYSLAGFSAFASLLAGIATFSGIGQANEKINAQTALSEAQFALNQRLDALRSGIQAIRELQQLQPWYAAYPETQKRVTDTFPQLIYGVRESNRFEGHNKKVEGVSFSPDGQILVSTSEDQTIKVWNRRGQLLDTLPGHTSWVNKISFSPDGKQFATASSDMTAKLWQIQCLSKQDNDCLDVEVTPVKTLEGHTNWITDVSFSPDGKTLITAGRDGRLKIWSNDGRLQKDITVSSTVSEETDENEVWGVGFSPDGRVIATANKDTTIKLFSLDGKLLKTLSAHTSLVRDVSFSPDGQYLASASDDNTAVLWTNEGTLIRKLEGHKGHVNRVNFSPNSQVLITASDGDSENIKLWQRDGTPLATLNGHIDRVKDVSFRPDGQILATASWDTTIRLWNLAGLFPKTLEGHQDRVMDISFSPDGKTLASASWDQTVKFWDQNGNLLRTLRHLDKVNGVSFSPDGELLVSVTAEKDQSVWLWNQNGEQQRILIGHTDYIRAVSFDPDNQIFATAGGEADQTVRLWNREGQLLHVLSGHQGGVYGVSFSPDGQLIASSSKDSTIKLWNREGQLLKTFTGHTGWIWNVSFSPDSQMIVSASEDNTVKLWKQDGTLIKTLEGHTARVSDVNFSPDGQIIATGSSDATIKLWNREGQLLTTLEGHADRVMSVSFSPNGKLLASTSVDKTIKLWNLEDLRLTNEINTLIDQGCAWINDYLTTNQKLNNNERELCNGINNES
jgi:WD40 repeat protein/energy-coupling factor transporter ATP-binding protein EcfA2